MERINIQTGGRIELVDITDKVALIVSKSRIKNGICFIFCPNLSPAGCDRAGRLQKRMT